MSTKTKFKGFVVGTKEQIDAITSKDEDKLYIVTDDGGGVEIVQTTGTSTTAAMSQKAVTDELGKKLNAVTETSTYAMAYVKSPNGTQNMVNIVGYASAGQIPMYSTNETLVTSDPVGNNDAANKKYVDDSIAAAITTTLNTAV